MDKDFSPGVELTREQLEYIVGRGSTTQVLAISNH
jgi:hypothetical protein